MKTNIFTRTINKIKYGVSNIVKKINLKRLRKDLDNLNDAIFEDLKSLATFDTNLFSVRDNDLYLKSDFRHDTSSAYIYHEADANTVLRTLIIKQDYSDWEGKLDYVDIETDEVERVLKRFTEYLATTENLPQDRTEVLYDKPHIRINTIAGIYDVAFDPTYLTKCFISEFHCVRNTHFEYAITEICGTVNAHHQSKKKEWDTAFTKWFNRMRMFFINLLDDCDTTMKPEDFVKHLDNALCSDWMREYGTFDDNSLSFILNYMIISFCREQPEKAVKVIASDDAIRPAIACMYNKALEEYFNYELTVDAMTSLLRDFNITKYRLSKLFPRNTYDAWKAAKREPGYGPVGYRTIGDIFLENFEGCEMERITKPAYLFRIRKDANSEWLVYGLNNFTDTVRTIPALKEIASVYNYDALIWAYGYVCTKINKIV